MDDEKSRKVSSEEVPPEAAPAARRRSLWITRRDFFSVTGWRLLWIGLTVSALGLIRFFFPRALYEPPSSFKAGFPDEYPMGSVSEKYLKTHRTFLIHNEEGVIYALHAKCTHLGCTVIWSAAENKFKCPCHGSGFHRSGINFEGPAPRALERFQISQARDGRIMVDRGRIFREERGEWEEPGSQLRL